MLEGTNTKSSGSRGPIAIHSRARAHRRDDDVAGRAMFAQHRQGSADVHRRGAHALPSAMSAAPGLPAATQAR